MKPACCREMYSKTSRTRRRLIRAGRGRVSRLPCQSWFGNVSPAEAPILLQRCSSSLIFSGPPRLRIRDAEASLRGEVDWVVILHVVVWAFAGLWVLYQIWKHLQAKSLIPHFSLPQKLGLAMTFCLAVSAVIARASGS